jgi:peptide/nickel transport system permease protein
VRAAARRGGWVDRGITFVALTLYSMPAFWLGLMLLLVFAFRLGWLPAGQMGSIDHAALPLGARFWDTLRHLLLPVLVLSLGGVAATARYMRAALLEVLSQDYVRTARAKGLAESRVVWVHALRNALLPAATLLGLSFPALIGGALVVEYVFAWPGMGRLTVDALFARDYPIIMATTFLSAVMVVTGNLVADLLYAGLDPRIRLSA